MCLAIIFKPSQYWFYFAIDIWNDFFYIGQPIQMNHLKLTRDEIHNLQFYAILDIYAMWTLCQILFSMH